MLLVCQVTARSKSLNSQKLSPSEPEAGNYESEMSKSNNRDISPLKHTENSITFPMINYLTNSLF